MFVILFAYVFGGAIAVPGGNYHEYLMGGIFIQTLVFGVMGPATSMANDLSEGVLDRFRSLPMARSAFLVGHVMAEFAAAMLGVAVMTAAGLVVGWRIHTDVPHAAAGFALIVLVAFTMLWVGHVARDRRALGRRRDRDRLHRHLPADLRGQRLRARRHAAGRPADGGRVEPGQRARRRPAHAVRQPDRHPARRRVAAASTPWPARSCGARRCWR